VSGIGAVLARLRLLISDTKHSKLAEGTRNPSDHIKDLLDVLSHTLKDDELSWRIWTDIATLAPNPVQQTMIWKEYVSQTASGKIVSIAAEAEDALGVSLTSRKEAWLAQGSEYATWLGRNIVNMIQPMDSSNEQEVAGTSSLVGKAMMLGHTGKSTKQVALEPSNGTRPPDQSFACTASQSEVHLQATKSTSAISGLSATAVLEFHHYLSLERSSQLHLKCQN
jgi:telomere length regulation protein